MALSKQTVSVPFTNGSDRKTEDALVIPSKVAMLENHQFVEQNTIGLRAGFQNLISSSPAGGATTPRRIFGRDGELLMETDNGVYTADVIGNTWRQKATDFTRASAELASVAHPTAGDVLESDVAGVAGGLQVTVWTDMGTLGGGYSPTVYVQVRRGAQVLMQQALTSTESCCPKVVYSSADSKFFLYWVENNAGTGNIKAATISTATPTTVSAVNTVESTYMLASTTGATTGVPMTAFMDVVLNTFTTGRSIYITHRSVTGGSVGGVRGLKVSISDGFTISASSSNTVAQLGGNPCIGIAAVAANQGGGAAIYAYYAKTSTTIAMSSALLDSAGAYGVPTTVARTPTGKIVAMLDNTDGFQTRTLVLWDEGGGGTPTSQIVAGISTTAGGAFSAGYPAVAARSVGLASGMFQIYGLSVYYYVGAYLYSSVQPTLYALSVFRLPFDSVTPINNLITSSHDICARVSCLAAPIRNRFQQERSTPRALSITDPLTGIPTGVVIPMLRSTQDVVSIGTTVPVNNVADSNRTTVGLDLLTLDITAQLNHVEIDQSTVLAGADPHFYDGQSLVELGFEYFPETPSASAGGVGTLPAGTYGVTCLYEWVDRYGITHQSAPAIPTSVVVALNQRITVTVPTLRLTKKMNARIVVYRTIANGSTFYRVQGDVAYSNSVANSTAVDSITLASESLGDVTVQTGEPLPTTGGILAAEAFPSCKFISLHQDRLVFSGLVDRTLLQYTDERTVAFFPTTNTIAYTLQVGTEFGRVSATASMDDKLIVGQEKQIGVIFGRGPNRLGLDNQFSNTTRAIPGMGHSWAESNIFVQDPEGLWFRDPSNGLRHMNRGLALSEDQFEQIMLPRGSEVDGDISTLTAAVYLTSKKQVRFLNTANALVWDVAFRQWSKFTGPNQFNDGLAGKNETTGAAEFRFLSTSAALVFKDGGTDDNGTAIVGTLETTWIKLATLMGFQRVYAAMILGKDVGTLNTRGYTLNGNALIDATAVPVNGALGAEAAGDLVTIDADLSASGRLNIYQILTAAAGTFNLVEKLRKQSADLTALTSYMPTNTVSLEAGVDYRPSYRAAVTAKHRPMETNAPLQAEYPLVEQKCESIRFRIKQTSTRGGARLTGLELSVGLKPGKFKLESSKRAS